MRSCVKSYCCCLFLLISLTAVSAQTACIEPSQCADYLRRSMCYKLADSVPNQCPLSCLNPCLCDVSSKTNDTACNCILKAESGYCDLPESLKDCSSTCAQVKSVHCGPRSPPVDPNAHLSTNKTNFLTVVTEECNFGYKPARLKNQGMRICLMDTTWSEITFYRNPVNCLPIDCKNPPPAVNSTLAMNGTTEGSEAKYTCLKGYISDNHENETLLTCLKNETWSGDFIQCQPIDCAKPPLSFGADVTYERTNFEATANYSCQIGLKYQSGDNVLTCGVTGTWEGSPLSCVAIDCGAPPVHVNTKVYVTNTTYGHYAKYTCVQGYTSSTNASNLYCDSGGQWKGTVNDCREINCNSPVALPNVMVEVSLTTFGHTAKYRCHSGFQSPVAEVTIACAADGQWTQASIICSAINCSSAPVFPNAHQPSTPGQDTFKYKDEVVYECTHPARGKEGLRWTLECDANEQWVGAEPQCEGPGIKNSVLTAVDKYGWFLGAGLLGTLASLSVLFVILMLAMTDKLCCKHRVKSLGKRMRKLSSKQKIKPVSKDYENLRSSHDQASPIDGGLHV